MVLGIREGQWKLVDRSQRPGAHPSPAPRVQETPEAEARRRRAEQLFMPGEIDYATASLELYDLKNDPGETTNVAGAHPEIVDRLRKRLAEIREQGHS
jgi:hypothetical protein